jgi:hypothetical protein
MKVNMETSVIDLECIYTSRGTSDNNLQTNERRQETCVVSMAKNNGGNAEYH